MLWFCDLTWLYCIFYSRARIQVESIDKFSWFMARTMCFRPRRVLLGVVITLFTTTMQSYIVTSMASTRSSADADKPARRVWRSVKVIKHSTIPYARYSFLLCNGNFVFKFLRYSTSKNIVPLKWSQRSIKVIENGIIR